MEYDIKEMNHDVLNYLRKNTLLGPVAMFKIAKARREAELLRKYYAEVEHEIIELDTSTADELEYNYRMQAMQKKMYKMWQQYGDGLDLEEFVNVAIANNMENEKGKTL